jgi:hypothetical protein
MPNTKRLFVKAMHDAWGDGYWVTWLPSTRYRLGDIGQIDGSGQLIGISTMAEQDIMSTTTQGETKDELTWRSSGDVNVTFKATGSTSDQFHALAAAQAGARVEFSGSKGVLVAYRGLSETRLTNQPALAVELLARYAKGTWDVDWCVISQIVVAESGTVLIAGDGKSTAELAADGSVGSGPITVADLSANVRVAHSNGLGLEFLGADVTPFFRVLRLRKRFLRGIEAQYGSAQRFRTAFDLSADVPVDFTEEALDDHEAILETVRQPIED